MRRRAWLAAVRWRAAARARLDIAREHPRHIVLFSLAAGLALGPVSPAATVAATAVAAAVGGRRTLATLAAGAVLLGAVVADTRLAALDGRALRALEGERFEGAATILEPIRERGRHAVARVRLAGLDETAVARLRATGHAWPPVGAIGAVSGRIAALGKYDAYQHRRGAQAALEVDRWRATGASRGGLSGALDSVRRRAEGGLGRGLAPPEAALLAGMVLGQDERLSEAVRDDFKRSGLAHLFSVRP